MEDKLKELLKVLDEKIEVANKEYRQLLYRCSSSKFWYEYMDRQCGYLTGLEDARKLIEQYLN